MCERCNRAVAAAPWHRHTRLMVQQCNRRQARKLHRELAGRSAPIKQAREVGNEDAVWLSLLGLALVLATFFISWGLL